MRIIRNQVIKERMEVQNTRITYNRRNNRKINCKLFSRNGREGTTKEYVQMEFSWQKKDVVL